MHIGTVRNLRDARLFSASCERESGVVADPAWVLDAGARVLAQRGVLLGGYVLETEHSALTDGLIPAAGVKLPKDRVAIAAFWVHHGLSLKLRRRVSRQLVSDVRATGKRNVVVVTPRQTPDPILEHGLPTQAYAGASGHPEVAWIQVRTGTAATLRRACLARMLQKVIRGEGQGADLGRSVAVARG